MIGAISGVTYAPLINSVVALGEEIGWRGFLYPQLKARFGRKKGWLLAGFIWGAWHWPLIWLIGYEYGAAAGNPAGYAGFPVIGMLLFCVITIGWGILHDWLWFCHSKRVVIPGTEGMKGYKDYLFHARGSLKGMLLGAPAALVAGILVAIIS